MVDFLFGQSELPKQSHPPQHSEPSNKEGNNNHWSNEKNCWHYSHVHAKELMATIPT
jgi:hypothetical protein